MPIKISGLDEFRRKLERLSRHAQNVNGPVAFDDLFPPEFMRRYTDFPTIQAMADASGFKFGSREDFEARLSPTWNGMRLSGVVHGSKRGGTCRRRRVRIPRPAIGSRSVPHGGQSERRACSPRRASTPGTGQRGAPYPPLQPSNGESVRSLDHQVHLFSRQASSRRNGAQGG